MTGITLDSGLARVQPMASLKEFQYPLGQDVDPTEVVTIVPTPTQRTVEATVRRA